MRARNILNLILISGSLSLAGVSLSLMSPFYPSEALAKGVTVTQSGIVIGSVFISTIIFTPICGKYIDVLGARRFLLLGSAICALGNIVSGFLDQVHGSRAFFWASILVRVLVALGESTMTVSCYTLAAQQVPIQHQGKAISIAEAAFGVGTMFGPSIGGLFYEIGGFSVPFWITGGALLVMSVLLSFCLEDKNDLYTRLEDGGSVTWKQILCAPNVGISLFALVFAGSSWSWYSATLEPFMSEEFGLTSAKTGLVFTAFGATYTLFTPIFGFLSDKGLSGLPAIILGNSIIAFGYLFLGPIPQFASISGNLWLSIGSISIQGMGSAATYLGSLLLMMKGVKDAGLPETEQVKSMVSSLWIVGDCLGGYAGTTLGSFAYDRAGFKAGTLIELIALITTTVAMTLLAVLGYYCSCRKISKNNNNDEEDEKEREEEAEKRRLLKQHEREGRTYGS